MEPVWIATALGAVVVVVVVVALWRRRGSSAHESERAHEAAQEREPPVEIGGSYELGITEFTDHHSGGRVAVGKVEGFVVFVEDIPTDARVGDAIRAKVTSFNTDRTSADAIFVESV